MTLHVDNVNTLRVLAISGSIRTASSNTGLLRAAEEIAPDGMEITIFDIRDVPFYNEDIEAQGDPASVTALKLALRGADAVLFATPEYNGGTSGALKNAIYWASRDREVGSLRGKPTAIVGAGGGTGTARAQMQLLQTLGETGSVVMVEPGVQINGCAAQTFDSDGNLIDESIRELLRRHLDAFNQWIQLVRPG